MPRNSLVILVLSLWICVDFFAQSVKIDSLQQLLKFATTDTQRISLLILLADESEGEKAIELRSSVLKLSQQLISTSKTPPVVQKAFEGFVYVYDARAFLFKESGKQDSALKNFLKALHYCKYIENNRLKAEVYNDYGLYLQSIGELTKVIPVYDSALAFSEKSTDKKMIARVLNNLGAVYNNLGDINKALNNYHRSLKLKEAENDVRGIALSYNNIGFVHKQQGDFSSAEKYYEKSLNLHKKINNKTGMAVSYNNLGVIYRKQKKYDKALACYEQSLALYQSTFNKQSMPPVMINIGRIYEIMNKNKEAERVFKEALVLAIEVKDKISEINLNIGLGEKYQKEGRKNLAMPYADKAFEQAEQTGNIDLIADAALLKYKCAKETGDYKNAMDYFQLHVQYRDSLMNEENKKVTIKNELQYEYEKKSAEDSVKTAEERKVVITQLKQEKTQRYSLFFGLLLVVVFAAFMANRFRITNKQKKLIEEQKKTVEHQKQLVEMKQREIIDSIQYAKRIQTALITSNFYINKSLQRLNK